MRNLNFILEQISASTSLLTFFFLCWSTWYLWTFLEYRGVHSWRTIFVALPPAMVLLLVMYFENIGTLMTHATIWAWRAVSGGVLPFTTVQTICLLLGATGTAVGTLFLIRVLSRPQLGEWPWIGSAIIAGGWLIFSTLLHVFAA